MGLLLLMLRENDKVLKKAKYLSGFFVETVEGRAGQQLSVHPG